MAHIIFSLTFWGWQSTFLKFSLFNTKDYVFLISICTIIIHKIELIQFLIILLIKHNFFSENCKYKKNSSIAPLHVSLSKKKYIRFPWKENMLCTWLERPKTVFVFWWATLSLWPHFLWGQEEVCVWVSQGWPSSHTRSVLVFPSTSLAPDCRRRQANRHNPF